jgi:DNA-binding transcriptional LysR family regulator
MLRIEHCKYFIAVAESVSISNAAEKLNISQSHLSQCLTQLESIVGTKLLHRSSKGTQLTTKGIECLSHCHKLMEEVYTLTSLSNLDATRQALRVATFYASSPIDVFYEVTRHLNATEHDLLEVLNRNVIDLVLSGNVYLGVLYLEDRVLPSFLKVFSTNGLRWHQLTNEPVDIAMSSLHPLASKDYLTLDDIRHYPLLFDQSKHTNKSFGHLALLPEEDQKEYIDQSLKFLNKLTLLEMGFNNLRSLMYYLTKNTLAIAFAQKRYNQNDPLTKNGDIRYIPLYQDDFKLVTGIVCKRPLQFSLIEEQFIQTLREQLQLKNDKNNTPQPKF